MNSSKCRKRYTSERKWEKKRMREERTIQQLIMYNELEQEEEENGNDEKGRNYTLSIAVPASILDNAQTWDLQTYLAGQVARAAAIFNVDEVVVYNDKVQVGLDGQTPECMALMAKVLEYLECPQYLRKQFFPIQKLLQFAGVLNPLDAPHHLRRDEHSPFREGVVVSSERDGSYVDVGLKSNIMVKKQIDAGTRVTVKLTGQLTGRVVPPSAPRTTHGLYWGYSVRTCDSLHSVFTQSPFPGGYDLTVGTSERGTDAKEVTFPAFKHCLVAFGSLQGLEDALECDEALTVNDPALLFDLYLNTCPGQGSRTIRTEEAILISLAAIKDKVQKGGEQK